MLKESEELVKRRKLSLTHTATTATAAVTTPPVTPPTPPLNMMASAHSGGNTIAAATVAAARDTLADTAAVPPTLTPTTMAASLLTSVANTPTTTAAATAAVVAAAAAVAAGVAASTPAPAVQDHYSLRWNNHQNHILRAFDALLQTKTLVDVTLVCAEISIHAHKMVLSACSPFFQRVFAETPCKHPVIVLKDFQGWVVQAIVDFMYRGEISVPQERLQTLIQAGESLQVRGLVESSVPEHTPTPAASPDDFGMIDTSLMSSELERCSSFDEESPSMVTAGSKVILPSRLFGSSTRRERERERKRERERERERERDRELEREVESDQELPHESGGHSDLCTSPMPRRKQARPRRRSGELPHELASKPASPTPPEEQQEPMALDMPLDNLHTENLEALKTVIKSELTEAMDEDEPEREDDSGNGNDSHENNELHDKPPTSYHPNHDQRPDSSSEREATPQPNTEHHSMDGEDEDNEEEPEQESEDIEELINTTNELRRKSMSGLSDGPEDLCTTKKDHNDINGSQSPSDNEGSPANNNNNNNSKLNNNNRIVLSLKDIRHLNKSSSSSTPNSSNNMHPFATASLRDLRLDRASNAAAENQCKMDALEAQMHAAAAAAAAAAASGENPFQHMEHQMDLSLAAAAAAAAVSHQQSRERDQAMQREQRELQQQHNAYANSILGQMGMPGMPPFGPGGPGGGPAPHERLEESMNRLSKEFAPSSPMSLPTHFNPPDGPPHPPSPLQFPGMSSALTLTPPHMFGLDSPLGLFPPGIDPGKLYNPLMEMSDPRGMPGDHPPPFLKKKMPRPKGQHSAPRGGPPRSWTNAELTEALQHVWNKKMTTSQASRIFGIPYNSLLMYVRGKYGKSLKLEQLRKDCISGPPLELLQMGISGGGSSSANKNGGGNNGGSSGGCSGSGPGGNGSGSGGNNESRKEKGSSGGGGGGGGGVGSASGNGSADMELGMPAGPGGGPRSASSEPDLLGGHNSLFNPFPGGFYPDFPGGFPGLPLGMLNLLPPTERHQPPGSSGHMHHLGLDEDCKSDRSKQSSSLDDEFAASALSGGVQPLALSRDEQRRGAELLAAGPVPVSQAAGSTTQQNGGVQD